MRSLIGVWGLFAIPSLLCLLVLHLGTWGLPLGTHIGIVTRLTTLEASGVYRVGRCIGSHWCTHWSSLLILLESGARCLRSGLLKLLPCVLEWLSGTQGLLLPKVPTWSSIAERRSLLWGKARTSDTPRLSIAGGFPLLLSQLSTLVLQTKWHCLLGSGTCGRCVTLADTVVVHLAHLGTVPTSYHHQQLP
jgi:hypothetical protein